jgi:hypothetical protein
MKKILLVLFIILLAAIAAFVAINLKDQSLNPDAFTLADLPPLNFEVSNGYYIVYWLAEPEEVDLQSDAYIKPIREYYNSTSLREMLKHNDLSLSIPAYYKWPYKELLRQIKFPGNYQIDLIGHLAPQWELVEKVGQKLKLPLKLWRKLLECEVVQDFCLPYWGASWPTLMPVWHLARFYPCLALKKAVEGNWQEGAADLLAQVELGKKFNTNSRGMVNTQIGRAIIYSSLHGLISMLNHPECPETVVKQILDGLPPIKYREYGNHNAFIAEGIFYSSGVDFRQIVHEEEGVGLLEKLLFQVNTTKNYYYDLYSKSIAYDRQDPYLWKLDPGVELQAFVDSKKKGFLNKFKNYFGKKSFVINVRFSIYSELFKSNRLRAYYMMTRILAELRLKYTEGRDIQEVLAELAAYKVMDPCSGKPFILNKKSWVLYSIGIDKKDQGGIENNTPSYETDVAIPLTFWSPELVTRVPQKKDLPTL